MLSQKTPTNSSPQPDYQAERTLQLAKLKRQAAQAQGTGEAIWHLPPDTDWQEWVTKLFPSYVTSGFSPRHVTFWNWVWSIESGVRPPPFVAIWSRGGSKSTSVELACVALGQRKKRNYAVYLSGTQDQADKHVATIAAQLESIGVDRALNKYGASRGWRRERLRTSGGFTVDALGLDTASRGIKTEEKRPDLICFDDLDDRHDSKEVAQKKIETLTQTILPSGSSDCAVLGCQNLIHANSIFSQLADGRADFLLDRIVSGPFKAINDLQYEREGDRIKIVGGVATWEGQSLQVCEGNILTWGLRAFLREAQHEVGDVPGALWRTATIDATRVNSAPDLVRVVVAIDPAGKSGAKSDDHGIGVSGRDARMHFYPLADYTLHGDPSQCAVRAICAYIIHSADKMVGEVNNGGDWIGTVIKDVSVESVRKELVLMGRDPDKAVAGDKVNYGIVHASRGKEVRAEPISALYSEGKVHHVGNLQLLEDEMVSWIPGRGRSPNRVDWLVWSIKELQGGGWVRGPGA